MMKHLRPVWPAFVCLLASLPSLLSAGPWDNRSRPAGFQRTLSYLAPELHSYPNPDLQKIRNSMLNDDLTTTLIPQLQKLPPSTWEAEGQKAFDAYGVQYEAMKNIIRQTMNDAEGIIQTVESGQRVPDNLASHPNVVGLIALRWQRLNIAEQTYQALLFAGQNPGSGSGGTHNSVPDVTPRQPAKSQNRIDWERMRETRRKAIERRRVLEARWAEEARRRWEEINEIIRYLRGLGAQSANKFQATRRGAGGQVANPAPPEPTPMPAEPAGEPPSTIEEIQTIEEEIEQLEEKIEAEESTQVEKAKVKVYRGALILRRVPGLDDASWKTVKKALVDVYSSMPGVSDMEDKGDEVTWRYKTLALPAGDDWVEVVPDGEPTEEEVDGEPAPEKKEEPKFVGNGDADMTEKDVPGSGPDPQTAKPAPRPKPAPKSEPKPEPKKPEAVMHDGYWFDPTDESRDDDDPFVYVRVNGVAQRIRLSQAPAAYGIPDGLTIDQMSWYNERLRKLEKNYNNTHRSKGANSFNKFAKPKG